MFTEIILWDLNKPLRERHNPHTGPYRWTPTEAGKGRGFYMHSKWPMTMGDAPIALRLDEANNHISGRLSGINGYYTDEFCDQTLQPIIARLNHRRGYLAGWTMGAGMCGNLDARIHATEEDAARAAHSMADSDAERERDYQASLCRECSKVQTIMFNASRRDVPGLILYLPERTSRRFAIREYRRGK